MSSTNYSKDKETALKLAVKRSALISWIESERKFAIKIMQVFSPAFKNEYYSRRYVNDYLRYAQRKAVLEDMLSHLISSKTTIEIFENIEYTLCKLYDIKYDEYLESYM